MRIVLLLVLFVCIVAYVRSEQPETWNSWMEAVGLNVSAASPPPADSGGPSATPPRPPQVGGIIKDGTFTAGKSYWQGDGQTDPSGKGLVVTLNPSSWTRVYQTFAADEGARYSIEVTYRLSPGITVSQDPADYTQVGKRLQIDGFENFGSINVPIGAFYGTVGDPTSTLIAMEFFLPHYGGTSVQDYQHAYPPIPPNGNKTFALAFPPGSGTVTLLTAYVASH